MAEHSGIRVLLVDDHALFREAVATILSREPDIQVVAEAPNAGEALELVRRYQPDVVLLDIRMPGNDGTTAIRPMKEVSPASAIIMLTMYSEEDLVFQAVREGASGYLLKDIPLSELIRAVRAAARGESLLEPAVAAKLVRGFRELSRGAVPRQIALSQREYEVLRCICRGMSNKEISTELFISEKTVKKHVRSIFQKLKVRSRSQAVIVAIQRGLVGVPRGAAPTREG